MKHRIALVFVIIITSLFTGACQYVNFDIGDTQQSTTVTGNNDMDDVLDKGPVKGGTLKVFSTAPDTLNPIMTQNTYVQEFLSMVYEPLVKLGKDQKPVYFLTDRKPDVSVDGLKWTFHIRENVFWHDKIPFTAEDVEFTLDTILNSKVNTIYKKNLQNISSFYKVDDSTICIILKKPYSFTAEMMTFPILPKHCFVGEDITNISSAANMKPVGTGPYRFVSYNKDHIILNANENWWGSGVFKDETDDLDSINKENTKGGELPELPYIAQIDIKIYKNSSDAINAFESKELDMASLEMNTSSKFKGRTDVTIKKYTGNDFEFLAFNLSKGLPSNADVRKAIATAIDKTALVDDVLMGDGVVTDIPVMPDTWMYDSNIMAYTHDAAKAKDMLIKSGWKDSNGTLRRSYGTLSLELLVNEDNDTRVKAAEEIVTQLAEAGITVQIKKVSWEDEQKLIAAKKFDMALIGCKVPSIPDMSFLYSSQQISGGMNIAGYNNPVVDDYLKRILVENDSNVQKALFINLKQVIDQDVPYIGLYFYNGATIFNKRIRGDLNPYNWNHINNFIKWYIPTV